ncbi:MAG: TRAP transporter TatT component family protein [Treponemataceae bacterium]|nr:TRAP transporter TatT component family protein [Treponemataceae bacterium]
MVKVVNKKIRAGILISLLILTLFSCASTPNIMEPIMGETDMLLLESSIPVVVKGVEVVHYAKPKNKAFAQYASMLYVMYANVFVQSKADVMEDSEYEIQYAEKQRAKMHYLRGKRYGLDYFNRRNKHFEEYITSRNPELEEKALKKMKKKDVAAAYWLGAGWLGAFALDPLDSSMLEDLRAPVLILEKACEIDPTFNNGAIWDVLCAFYAAAPADFGGDKKRAVECFLKEVEITKGQGTGIFMTYANTFCKGGLASFLDNECEWVCPYSFEEMGWKVPEIKHDEFLDSIGMGRNPDTKWPLPTGIDGFDWALDIVLAYPNDDPNSKLLTSMAKNKAKFLKEHRENYFIIW